MISLQFTFGGSPGHYGWGVISESICDIVDAILFNDNWGPNTLQVPNLELVPEKETLAPDIPVIEGI